MTLKMKDSMYYLKGIYLFIGLFFLSSCYRCEDAVKEYTLPKKYSGEVINKYIDTQDHFSRILVLKNSQKIYLTYYPMVCYDSIFSGDLVEKKKDSTYIHVKRGKNEYLFYPVCNDVEIKSIKNL